MVSNTPPPDADATHTLLISKDRSGPTGVAMADQPAGLDLVWGCKAIASVIGRTERATFHMLEKGELPARQVGQRWVASRAALEAFFREVAA